LSGANKLLGKKMHVVPFTVAAAAAAGEVEIAADWRAAELAAVCQQSVGHRGSKLDGDVARSRHSRATPRHRLSSQTLVLRTALC